MTAGNGTGPDENGTGPDENGTGPDENVIATGEVGNAIGSTEPTAEERCHWTPEMRALAVRDGAATADGCEGRGGREGAARE
jgi:hypothetical protein